MISDINSFYHVCVYNTKHAIIGGMDTLTVLFWSLLGSLFSLMGGLMIIKYVKRREVIIRYLLPFGAGSLLAVAFLSLLPEAAEVLDIHATVVWMLGGFLAFFILERALGWFHHHEHHHHELAHGSKNKTHQWLVIIGDTLHNAIDGVAIGAAFLVNPAIGVGTAIAVATHEVPQEIGDFGILLSKGMKPRGVIVVNLLSSLATVLLALATFWLGKYFVVDVTPLLAVAAGMFVYIAASDIIPDIHERPRKEGNLQAVMLLVGVVVLSVVLQATPLEHREDTDDVGTVSTSRIRL